MQSETEKNKIFKILEGTIGNLNNIIDVSTVIGKPVKDENGDYIIPIAKVTLGVLTGGGEYGKVGLFKNNDNLPYSAGNGAIISIKPCGFLVKDNDKNYKILSVSENACEKLIDKASDILSNLNAYEK